MTEQLGTLTVTELSAHYSSSLHLWQSSGPGLILWVYDNVMGVCPPFELAWPCKHL